MTRNTKIVKKITALFLVLLLSIDSFAAIVSDNDGSAFITKAEFDSLKNDFQSQIDQYNQSIDNKIDGAIASYIAGISISEKEELNNTYDRLGCGTIWMWGNNIGTRTEYPYGGCDAFWERYDSLAVAYGTATYIKNDWENILMLGSASIERVELQPYKYQIYLNERDWDHYYQNATTVWGDRSFYNLAGWENVKRDGTPYYSFSHTVGSYPESHLEWGNINEIYTKCDSTNKSVISVNNLANEYYIDKSGDSNGTIEIITKYTGKGTDTGTMVAGNNQTYIQKWRPSWGKYKKHNELRIKDFEDYTEKEEKIISGAPVAKIDNVFDEVIVTYKASTTGTLYIYNSEDPIKYTDLVDDNMRIQIESVTAANIEKTVTFTGTQKDTWIRMAFLPTSGTASLTISKIEALK